MKLHKCAENSLVTIDSIPEGLLNEAHQHGLCEGEIIRVIRNKIGVPLLIEVRGAKFGLRKQDAALINVKAISP